jgi:hypothetical protein
VILHNADKLASKITQISLLLISCEVPKSVHEEATNFTAEKKYGALTKIL